MTNSTNAEYHLDGRDDGAQGMSHHGKIVQLTPFILGFQRGQPAGKADQRPHNRSQHPSAEGHIVAIGYSPIPMAEMGREYAFAEVKSCH